MGHGISTRGWWRNVDRRERRWGHRERGRRTTELELLESRALLAADPVIAEFQAENLTTLADQDGDWSDWIEVANPDTQAISLSGWYLTDDASVLTKWQFPDVTLDAGQHLTVFASGKDRREAGSELHTNFRLSATGEYLALVRPDGTSIAHSYDTYPAQFEDQSYGLATGRDISQFIADTAPVRAYVPTDDTLGLDWTQPAFDDSAWQSGNLGAGFEVLQSGGKVRDDFDSDLSAEWTVDRPETSKSTVRVAAGKLVLNVPTGQDLVEPNDEDPDAEPLRGDAPLVYRSLPGDDPADWEVITEINQAAADRGAAGIAVFDAATGKPSVQVEYSSRISFRIVVNDDALVSKVSLSRDHYFLRLVRDGLASSWYGYYKLAEADDWTLIGVVDDSTTPGDGGVPFISQPRPALYARTPSSTMTAQFESIDIVVPDQRPVYGPMVGADVQAEMLDHNSSVYLRVPFDVGGDATRFDEMSLLTRFDDGFQAYLNGTPVASHNVPVDPVWNSSAAGSYGAVSGRLPARQYTLDGFTNLLRPGTNVLAVHGMNVAPDDPDFYFDATLSGAEILHQTAQYFATPTPGAPNQAAATPPPQILGEDGLFFDSTSVQIVMDEPNPLFQIRYTIDGSEPTIASTLYTEPVVLTESAMLQARIFDTSLSSPLDPGPVVAATYIAVANELKDRTSDIPLMILDTLGQSIPGSSSTTLASVNVLALDVSKATGRSSFNGGIVDYLGRGGIRDRGSSTAGQQKPNLAFETWGADGTTDDDDQDVALLGFGAESDWVLHAPFSFDPALIRNQLAYGMANAIGRWAPGTRVVEVYLNRRRDGVVGEDDYAGVYVLTERIKQGPDRVDITKISQVDTQEPEISGGYIWKIDREDPSEPSFSAGGANLNWVEPKSPVSRTASEDQKATPEQQAWVVDYFNKFRDASRNPDISDPEGYSKYIDVGSWIDHHLISVLGDNVDALNLSTYLFKDRGKKIEFGPQWDFDRSMESRDDRDNDPFKWGGSGGTNFFGSNYWSRLFTDPGFWQAYIDRWTELRRGELSDDSLNAMIDMYAGQVEESQERNNAKWAASRGRTSSAYNSGKLDGTWRGEVEHLRSWLLDRAHFMDSNFAQPPTLFVDDQAVPVGGMHVNAGETVRLEGPQLAYYVDTEFISSEVGEVTARYFSPSDDALGTDWAQPSFDDSNWASGPLGLGYDSGDDYSPMIRTEAAPAPDGTTILLRVPFQLDNLDDAENLFLRMRFDDGYVAYLNGTEVASRNLRDTDLTWDSRASSRRDVEGVLFDDMDITEYRDLLNVGDNVLGIRLINATPSSNDIFVQPALVSRREGFGISPVGDVYYTTDGTDPRGADGNPVPSAVLAPRGTQITIAANTKIIARNFDETTDRGTESRVVRTNWSAPVEYNFVTDTPRLVISEVNYNPAGVTDTEAQAGFTRQDFEFVEIYNAGTTTADLQGVALSDGVQFDFYGSAIEALAPGQFALVVANQQAFQARYGNGLPIAGQFEGNLSDSGEDLDLVDGVGQTLSTVNYRDSDLWGVAADGVGATLELVNPRQVRPEAQNKWYSWDSSSLPGGTPGRAAEPATGIVINEVLARTSQPVNQPDSIELLNTSSQPIEIGGWYLSDDVGRLNKYQIPAGTTLRPGSTWSLTKASLTRTRHRPVRKVSHSTASRARVCGWCNWTAMETSSASSMMCTSIRRPTANP